MKPSPAGTFPSDGLRYPKQDEKPAFMTRAEIERQIAAGGDSAIFWECLYLQATEVKELLAYVERNALHPWVYPAVCFAAHTGARRSEIIRAHIADLDLDGNTVLIREKKRRPGAADHPPRAADDVPQKGATEMAGRPPRRPEPFLPLRNGGTESEAEPDDGP